MAFLDLDEELSALGYGGGWEDQAAATFEKKKFLRDRANKALRLDGPTRRKKRLHAAAWIKGSGRQWALKYFREYRQAKKKADPELAKTRRKAKRARETAKIRVLQKYWKDLAAAPGTQLELL